MFICSGAISETDSHHTGLIPVPDYHTGLIIPTGGGGESSSSTSEYSSSSVRFNFPIGAKKYFFQ